MQAGKLRYPVTLEKASYQQNPETGEMIEQWVQVAREWADIEAISGREFIAAGAQQSETLFRIQVRYRSDLESSWRIRDGGKIYQITAALPDSRRRRLELMCRLMK